MKTPGKLFLGITLASLLLGGLAACGHYRSDDPVERIDYVADKVDHKLDLNESQRQQLDQLKNKLIAVARDMKTQRDATHNMIDELLSQPTLDQTRILNHIEERTADINKRAPEIVAAIAAFYDSLNPEQQAIIRKEFEDHRDRHYFWHH